MKPKRKRNAIPLPSPELQEKIYGFNLLEYKRRVAEEVAETERLDLNQKLERQLKELSKQFKGRKDIKIELLFDQDGKAATLIARKV